jgi:methylmalonyl-CoA/ethylmalonyl-CoA epimerase
MVPTSLKHLKIDHLAIAVYDLDHAEKLFCNLFKTEVFHRETVASQQVHVSFLSLGDQNLELVESLTEAGPVARFLERRGEGIHHIAFKVEDILKEMSRLEQAGFTLLQKAPVIGALNKKVCFIHPKSANGVLVEICQENESKM